MDTPYTWTALRENELSRNMLSVRKDKILIQKPMK